ncbi:MAG: hypothetical protein QOE65_338 [Solirubrobacteraceae bacterium]|jgi:hypothetical protein|nr:hypothetical protein [Solirubrobacteraceae bacterium]
MTREARVSARRVTREADIFACLTDAVVAPGRGLPTLGETDTREFLAGWLAASPRLVRVGLRAMLLAVEVGPLALGFGARLRRLEPAARLAYLARIQRGPTAPLSQALEALAKLGYYGDEGVMRSLGYDPVAVVERGRALRREEARW